MPQAWNADWFGQGGIRARHAGLWRGVEAQHLISTMSLVDDSVEQEVLERLLEGSKPPLPRGSEFLHYLLNTPFRYRSAHASRFRRSGDPGIWYGAESLHTACAEVAFWRWRFLQDSAGLQDQALHTQHTFFLAEVRGRAIDLTRAPWNGSAAWQQPHDYDPCQALAGAARQQAVQWIRYRSVREPAGFCGAVLDPVALSLPAPLQQQTWACKATRVSVFMQAGRERVSFDAATWSA